MKVIVLGAGVVGTTTAYYLRQAGHEVTVLDRQPAAGMETSFANAGQVSPGYSAPWAGPGVPLKAVQVDDDDPPPPGDPPAAGPVHVALDGADAAQLHRGRLPREQGPHGAAGGVLARLPDGAAGDTGLRYDDRQRGTLQLFRTQKQVDHVAEDTAVLDEGGVPYEVLDRAGCVAAEPALAHARGTFLGGLRLPGDETGDAHQFTQRLAALRRGGGVAFRYGVTVDRLEHEGGRITGVVAGRRRPPPTPTWWRSAATRARCWRRWASTSRSIR